MNSDPLADISPGTDVRSILTSAARNNAIARATKWVQSQQRGMIGGSGYGSVDHCLLHVYNATGEHRQAYEVLGIDGLAVDPDVNLSSFVNHPIIKGIKPTEDHRGKFVVLLAPADKEEVVMGLLLGVTIARLNVDKEDDEYAEIAKDAYELKTGGTGAAKIIAKQKGTGSKWGVVLISPQPQLDRFFILNEDFEQGSTVSARWWKEGADGAISKDTGEDFRVTDIFSWWAKAKKGAKGRAVRRDSVWAIYDLEQCK
jgi:hypothetical protein